MKLGKFDEEALLTIEEARVIEKTGWTWEEYSSIPPKKLKAWKKVWFAGKHEPVVGANDGTPKNSRKRKNPGR
jgi:hypothetical protein